MTSQIKNYDEYVSAYKKSIEDPEVFWDQEAKSFTWFEAYSKVLNWDFHQAKTEWFINGKTNIT